MRLLIASCLLLAGALGAGGAGAQESLRAEALDDHGGRVVRCESDDGRTKTCAADIRGGVRLARQLSKAACIEGANWGYGLEGVWVSDGCRAEFVLGFGYGDASGSGRGSGVFRCESKSGRWHLCEADTRRGVELIRQLSRGACIRDDTWGWNESGVWVSRGCRGEFRSLGRRGQPVRTIDPGRGDGRIERTFRCESVKGQERRCVEGPLHGVQLSRQLSRSSCVEGESWGWDRDAVWVSQGCRAEFRAW